MTGSRDSQQSHRPFPNSRRRLAIGAEPLDAESTHFRVWAPAATRVAVVLGQDGGHVTTGLDAEGDGYFSGVANARPGDRYRYRLDDAETLYPDPASRFQPDGPHGPSEVIDPASFDWSDALARRLAQRPGHVRNACRNVHAGRDVDGGGAELAELARSASRHRGDAGRGIPRALRLGLRRRQPVRADAPVRHARTISGASSITAHSSASA